MARPDDVDVADLAQRGLTPEQIVGEIQSTHGIDSRSAWEFYWIATNQWTGDAIDEESTDRG